MKQVSWGFLVLSTALAIGATASFPLGSQAQSSSKSDQWIHVRVESKDDGETVRVNVPVDMAVKVLPAIKHEPLHDGKVHLKCAELNEVDLHAVLEAVRSSRDAEFVTVQGNGNDVRVAKNGGYLYIHVTDNNRQHNATKNSPSTETSAKAPSTRESKVEIKIPMKVVDALLSGEKDELDVVAALHALSAAGETELVSVKDEENTVRVWIDSKSLAN